MKCEKCDTFLVLQFSTYEEATSGDGFNVYYCPKCGMKIYTSHKQHVVYWEKNCVPLADTASGLAYY